MTSGLLPHKSLVDVFRSDPHGASQSSAPLTSLGHWEYLRAPKVGVKVVFFNTWVSINVCLQLITFCYTLTVNFDNVTSGLVNATGVTENFVMRQPLVSQLCGGVLFRV